MKLTTQLLILLTAVPLGPQSFFLAYTERPRLNDQINLIASIVQFYHQRREFLLQALALKKEQNLRCNLDNGAGYLSRL